MQVIRARFIDGVNDTCRRPAVLRGVLVRQDAKFLDSIDAQIDAQSASRTAIREIVDDQVIDDEDVTCRARSGNGKRDSVSPGRPRVISASAPGSSPIPPTTPA
jgi:hypothetical protein